MFLVSASQAFRSQRDLSSYLMRITAPVLAGLDDLRLKKVCAELSTVQDAGLEFWRKIVLADDNGVPGNDPSEVTKEAPEDVGRETDSDDKEDKGEFFASLQEVQSRLVQYADDYKQASVDLDDTIIKEVARLKDLISNTDMGEFKSELKLPYVLDFKNSYIYASEILQALAGADHVKLFANSNVSEAETLYNTLFTEEMRERLTKLGIAKDESGLPVFSKIDGIRLFTVDEVAPKWADDLETVNQAATVMSTNRLTEYTEVLNSALTEIIKERTYNKNMLIMLNMLVTTVQQVAIALLAIKSYYARCLKTVNMAIYQFSKNVDKPAEIPGEEWLVPDTEE